MFDGPTEGLHIAFEEPHNKTENYGAAGQTHRDADRECFGSCQSMQGVFSSL